MKMSSFNARWSVLLVLFAGTMLVIAGCSSPTGSDTGGGTINITGTAPADASEFNGEYTVSKILGSGTSVDYFFCLQNEGGPNSINGVRWEFDGPATQLVIPIGIDLYSNDPITQTSPDTNITLVPVGESMTYGGTVRTTGLFKEPGISGYDFSLVFNINEMPVEAVPCPPPQPSSF